MLKRMEQDNLAMALAQQNAMLEETVCLYRE